MKKSKAVSLLLSLSLLVSATIPGTMALPAYATEEQDSGMKISKTAEANEDGTYTINLEAYATGRKFTSQVQKDVPTDIVLVLDQSGSMEKNNMNTYDFRPYENKSNNDYYNLRHNNNKGTKNLYHKLDDSSYVAVSVDREKTESGFNYTVCPNDWNNDGVSDSNYYNHKDSLYIKNGEKYEKVELSRKFNISKFSYTYTFPDSSIIVSNGYSSKPDFGEKGPLYVRSSNAQEYNYTYYYTDSNGNRQVIGTSSGPTTHPEFTLYEHYGTGSMSRLQALKNAVNTFTDSVSEKAKGKDGKLGSADDVNHRVAVVGFASGDYTKNEEYPKYENTEVFVGKKQYKYNENASKYYQEALQDMNTQNGQNNVNDSADALDGRGATYPNYGLEMANGILDANPVPQDEKRNRVVILFTDGTPGWSGFEKDVAASAISEAEKLKNNGVTVYSVGIFDGADATSPGNENDADDDTDTPEANWFMQNVSSNNGRPQNPSYYLSASDSDTLNDIFEQISDSIEDGGSATTLDEQTVVKDFVSDYFQFPVSTSANDITVQTVPCTEIKNGVPSWGEPETFENAKVTVDTETGAVDVSGFDFAANYVGMDNLNGTETLHNPANKLVISFTVEPKDGFLGGNGVPTNKGAFIYENKDADKPVLEFDKPTTSVPIKDVTVSAEDKNVYLLGDLTAEQINQGATATVGDVELKLGEENYGLEDWQNAYVNITVSYLDKDGNTINKLNDLKEDTSYTVKVMVTPTDGEAKAQEGEGKGAINVFKPELTFRDSDVYYGADVLPTDFSANKVSEIWKHSDTVDTSVAMIGEKPVLDLTYTPDDTKIQDGKVNTKQDIPVNTEVKIGTEYVQQYTTFAHQACYPNCSWNETVLDGKPAFLLHVKTCQLTINKRGGADGEPYVFNVYKDGEKYTDVTIVGNKIETIYELPIGEYTIKEDEGWSWRYSANNGSSATLSEHKPTGSITCTNKKTNKYWLN